MYTIAPAPNQFVASNLENPGEFYVNAVPLNLIVRYFEHGYVNQIAQVIDEKNHSEKWYIYDAGSWQEINREQLWFWTTEWQAGEQKADDDLQQGRYEEFDSIDDFIDSL